MSVRSRCAGLTCIASLLALLGSTFAQDAPSDEKALESGLEERVAVTLVEFTALVTDKRGNPIPDLTLDEIKVLKGGKPQRLAFIESVLGGRSVPATIAEAPSPAALFKDGELAEPIEDEPTVLPAEALRRIVLTFDVRNSTLRVREKWKEAALKWLDEEMQPDDSVALVVLRSHVEWLTDFERDQGKLRSALDTISLGYGAANRDRRDDMSALVENIRSLCTDPGGADDRRASSRRQGAGVDEQGCAYNLAEDFVQSWDLQAQETVEAIRALTGEVAAIPGRKAVILFSEGFVPDAAAAAASAMVTVFGMGKIDLPRVTWRLKKNQHQAINELYGVATAGDVSFFTLDTRRAADHGQGGMLEQASPMAYDNAGFNPWRELDWATRGSLTMLAKASGGRSFFGVKNLGEKLKTAAGGFYGLYRIGYYQDNSTPASGKVKLKVSRRRTQVSYPDEPGAWPHRAAEVGMDITIGAPALTGDSDKQSLPISLTMDLDRIPLRRGAGGRGCQMGAFVQAIRPDGTIAAERLDIVTVVMNRSEREEAKGKLYKHSTELSLPVGPYRLRARLSDDRQKILADRVIDLTVEMGAVEPGLRTQGQ